MKILVIAQHNGQSLNSATARAVSCAQAFNAAEIHVAVFTANGQNGAESDVKNVTMQAASLSGVDQVRLFDSPKNAEPTAAVLAPQVAALVEHYGAILVANTTFGKDLLPRVAGLLNVPMVTDLMTVMEPNQPGLNQPGPHQQGPREFERPIYAGNAIQRVTVPEGLPIVASIRAASWPVAEMNNTLAPINTVSSTADVPNHTRYQGVSQNDSDRPDLQAAERVVSGGRGVGAEGFTKLTALADRLKAAVGASRAAVDAGFVANDCQVGQTGKIIAPELYIAFGISGAIQHIAGIKDAGCIVAVNNNPDAAIFDVADLGLVGDWEPVVDELLKTM